MNTKSMLIFSAHFNNSKWQPSPLCKSDVILFCGTGKSLAILNIGSRHESAAYYVISNQYRRRWNFSDLHEIWYMIYEKGAKFWEKEFDKVVNILWNKCCLKIWRKRIIAGKVVGLTKYFATYWENILPFSEIREICIAPFSSESLHLSATAPALDFRTFCISVKIGNRLWSIARTTSQ